MKWIKRKYRERTVKVVKTYLQNDARYESTKENNVRNTMTEKTKINMNGNIKETRNRKNHMGRYKTTN